MEPEVEGTHRGSGQRKRSLPGGAQALCLPLQDNYTVQPSPPAHHNPVSHWVLVKHDWQELINR